MKIFLILLSSLLISACTPSNSVYVRKDILDENHKISEILIVVEYLNMKENLDGSFTFSEDVNLINQDEIYNLISGVLKDKGYPVSSAYLKSSGFIMDRSVVVRHYYNGKKENKMISPPFILRSFNLDESVIQGLEILMYELNKPVSRVLEDYRANIYNNYLEVMPMIDLPDDTAILLVESYRPKNAFLGSFDVGFGVGNSGASMGLYNRPYKPKTEVFFIHKGSGDLLWSNQTSLLGEENKEKFFQTFPTRQ